MKTQHSQIKQTNKNFKKKKKEGNSYTYYNMDKPGGHYAKRNKLVTKRQTLYDSTYIS